MRAVARTPTPSDVMRMILPIVSVEYFEPKNAVHFVSENRALHVVQ